MPASSNFEVKRAIYFVLFCSKNRGQILSHGLIRRNALAKMHYEQTPNKNGNFSTVDDISTAGNADPCYPKMATDYDALLKIANTPLLSQFFHDCVNDLIGLKEATFDNYNSDIEWTPDDFNKAKTAIQKFCRQNAHIENESFNALPGPKLQQDIHNGLAIRKEDILGMLAKESLRKNGFLVENIDWKLKWVLGSSHLASIREPLLQVDLRCCKSDAEEKLQTKVVNFEVNLEQLDSLIEQLEHAKNELKQ